MCLDMAVSIPQESLCPEVFLHHEIRLAGRLDAIRPPARCRTNDMCNDLPSEKSGAVSMCGESHLAVLLQAIT